jgi:hypothetical protein
MFMSCACMQSMQLSMARNTASCSGQFDCCDIFNVNDRMHCPLCSAVFVLCVVCAAGSDDESDDDDDDEQEEVEEDPYQLPVGHEVSSAAVQQHMRLIRV